MDRIEKIKKALHTLCELLELLAAALMVVGIIFAIAGLVMKGGLFRSAFQEPEGLMRFVERVFSIVIAIEFLQMLSKPDTDNVIEIILFLVARHMIVGETTPLENLISILGIVLLIVLRWFIHDLRRKYERERSSRQQEEKNDASTPTKP